MFEIGERIVCVDASPRYAGPTRLVEGETYTVTEIVPTPHGNAVCVLQASHSPARYGFYPDRFRKLPRARNIAAFRAALLSPVPLPEDVGV